MGIKTQEREREALPLIIRSPPRTQRRPARDKVQTMSSFSPRRGQNVQSPGQRFYLIYSSSSFLPVFLRPLLLFPTAFLPVFLLYLSLSSSSSFSCSRGNKCVDRLHWPRDRIAPHEKVRMMMNPVLVGLQGWTHSRLRYFFYLSLFFTSGYWEDF